MHRSVASPTGPLCKERTSKEYSQSAPPSPRPSNWFTPRAVVHGDVTPRNVLVRFGTGEPVLVDFGTAFQPQEVDIARELSHVTSRFGTAWYVPPEKLRGEPVDARADLYGLGCILYELLTDRRPSPGSQSLNLPSQFNRDLPAGLDDLIVRLLADNPADRIGRADMVARILRNLLGGTTGDRSSTQRRPVPLYRSRLVDRESPMTELSKLMDALDNGSGGVVVIAGESGIGKTRLVNEVSARASSKGLIVPFPRNAVELSDSRPAAPWARAASSRCFPFFNSRRIDAWIRDTAT